MNQKMSRQNQKKHINSETGSVLHVNEILTLGSLESPTGGPQQTVPWQTDREYRPRPKGVGLNYKTQDYGS